MTSFWHPFAAMGSVAGNELTIEHGDGVYVWDSAGKRYLDGTAALWYCNVGHGRTEILEANHHRLAKGEVSLHWMNTDGGNWGRRAKPSSRC